MSKKQRAIIDDELERQLASAGDRCVGAVFTLRAPKDAPLIDANEVRQMVDRIVKTAQAAAGGKIHDMNVMPNAQSFAVEAPAGVVRAILNSADIASALANQQSEDLAIEPVPRPAEKGSRRGGGKTKKGED